MRNPTIDYLKFLALLCMTIYHIRFVSFFYDGQDMGTVIDWLGHIARFLFLFLFGLNFKFYENRPMPYFGWRLLRLGVCAVLISLATYLVIPEYFVVFGVIHLFFLSLLVLKFFPTSIKNLLLFISLASMFAPEITWSHNYLLVAGLASFDFQSVDYFPLIPYFGIIYLGYLMNNFMLNYIPRIPANKYVEYVSKHALEFYMLHLPIILLFRYMLK